MKKVIFVIIILLLVLAFFWPKDSGGSLCGGPICIGVGVLRYDKTCLGFEKDEIILDGASEICYGLALNKKCYGKVTRDDPETEMDCDTK